MVTIVSNGVTISANLHFDLDTGTCKVTAAKPGQIVEATGNSVDLAVSMLKNSGIFAASVTPVVGEISLGIKG